MKKGYMSTSVLLFAALAVFGAVTAVFNYLAGAAELAAVLVIFIIYRRIRTANRRSIARAVDTMAVPGTTLPPLNVLNLPLPACVARLDTGEVVWTNPSFMAITGRRESLFEMTVEQLVPDFSLKWVMEGKSECPVDVTLSGKVYKVYGALARHGEVNLSALLYWIDATELTKLRGEMKMKQPVVGVIALDNYEEITKHLSDGAKSSLLAAIDDRISGYFELTESIMRKYDRDRYLVIFEERHLRKLIEGKFSLLDSVRELTGNSTLPATLSVGLGVDGSAPTESLAFANLALDMALSRGGDQVVIKSKLRFEFFGGKSKEMEKRTKVKSRVMANALRELMHDASLVLIMGHKQTDIDSIGAACGLVAMARKLGRKAHIVADVNHTAAQKLISRLSAQREYNGVFIDTQTALLLADRETLLVIVDTSRPEIVESMELLQSIQRVAVIDHHRRAETYIDHATLMFHEPYASSACEMVAELVQYVIDPADLTRDEAEGMLAGITMDTKGFTMHTGVRTFEAAAYLRSAGADTVNVKRMLQTDFSSNLARYAIVANAEMINTQIAVATSEKSADRVVAAQAADDLLSISGIQASFVLTRAGNQVVICARSLGDINVQVIAEKLGGGGHQTIAGAQVQSKNVDEVKERLIAAVEEYYEERG